jgi:DUF4097 and DUF4098 domain-containing protein YvlB
LAEIKLSVKSKGDVVTIKWDTNEPVVNRSLDITVKAPRAASLRVSTGNGPIRIEGFRRGANAETGVGAITLREVSGDLTLHTGNGPIDVEGAAGAVKAETGVGSVAIKGPDGPRTVHTGNGPIHLEGAVGAVSAHTDVGRIQVEHSKGDLTLHTGNGPIDVRDTDGGIVAETGVGAVAVSGRLAGPCRITTGNGAIHLSVPADSTLTIDAETGNGAIHNDFALPVEGMVSHQCRGRLGTGAGGSLRLQTGVGSIDLRRQ